MQDEPATLLPAYLRGERQALEAYAKAHYQSAYLGPDRVLCRVLGRYLMYLDPSDMDITPHLCLDGFWESWVTIAIARHLRPGMHCIDVGANQGYFTLLLADAVGASGRVLAIEPNPELAAITRLSLHANGFGERAQVSERAAADSSGDRVRLVVPPHRAATGSICREPRAGERTLDVATLSIDDAVTGWPRLDFIKIDAEGAELAIWAGMQRALARFPQLTVCMELTPSAHSQPHAFLEQVEAAGYPLRTVSSDGEPRTVSRAELLQAPQWTMLWLCRD